MPLQLWRELRDDVGGMTALAGKTALVTGAQRGIGAAIARRLAADGAHVWINAVEELDRARGLATELGGDVVEADVSDPDAVERMLTVTGPLDIVINNAADQTNQALLDADQPTWERTLAVNVTGPMLVTQAAAPAMPPGSAIVNIASVHASLPFRGAAAYATSKAALVMLTRQSAIELAPRQIRVNAVAPGAIDVRDVHGRPRPPDENTERIPLRRPGVPEEVAAVVAFLASDDASYVTGAVWAVDGGLRIADPWSP